MASTGLPFEGFGLTWRSLQHRLAPGRESSCLHASHLWQRLTGTPSTVLLSGSKYCLDACLEPALEDALLQARSSVNHRSVPHRVPLGLLLLSRQHVTVEQLTSALDSQRAAGYGRIGEWLLTFGYVSKEQIIAALARQWSCPVLRDNSWTPRPERIPPLPPTLLERSLMVPVGYAPASAALHLAFGDSIDHNLLYAIERMTGCHTEPCFALPESIQFRLRILIEQQTKNEVVFECETQVPESARIVRSYCARVSACEVRIAAAGLYTWVRLFRRRGPCLDLLFRCSSSSDTPQPPIPKVPSAFADENFGG